MFLRHITADENVRRELSAVTAAALYSRLTDLYFQRR